LSNSLSNIPQEQLLGRPSAPLGLLRSEQITGRRIAVTGAAGSVGGPLVRMLAELEPAELLLLDNHEHTLFRLKLELGKEMKVPTRWALADIRDRRKLELLFRASRPEILFHLAAYKHVPLGEENPDQTVEVNLAGTRALIEAAAEVGTSRFIYPSSDKAVKPPSVYGGTKRIAEALALAANDQFDMEVSISRFVNIVGTRGSVIETFHGQIAEGKPLTLTDPGMTRYWITMPEATRLLAQTACHPEAGVILMPDPGPAINLSAMARHLYAMLAPYPDVECPIQFIGPRPGERMHEILLADSEAARPTPYPGIVQVISSLPERPDYQQVSRSIDALLEMATAGDTTTLKGHVLDLAHSLQ
jgi:FlaA1/EpsC-like NDP-sugar epimerase